MTLLPVAPGLRRWLEVPTDVERALAVSREGKRLTWSQRAAHGIVDALLDWLAASGARVAITLDNPDAMEPLDRTLLDALAWRVDGDLFRIATSADAGSPSPPDPRDAATLADAANAAMDRAHYHAALDLADLAEQRLSADAPAALRARIAHDRLFALLLLERYDAVDALAQALDRPETEPAILVHARYARAILHARFHRPERRDLTLAKQLVAGALAALEPRPANAATVVNCAFLHNTLALIALREGETARAERLLTEAIAALRRDAPDHMASDGPILFHNVARLHRRAGRPEEALAALDRLHALEPSHAEGWFDRGLIHQEAGRHANALDAYDQALFWAPPQIETLHNRASSLRALGRHAEARAACERVLALDPDHLPARVDTAMLARDAGDRDAMLRDIAIGLRLAPDDARLRCLAGIAALDAAELDEAEAQFDAAIASDPALADGWANRAIARARAGKRYGAVADLDRALVLRDDPVIRRNRARLLAALADQVIGESIAAR